MRMNSAPKNNYLIHLSNTHKALQAYLKTIYPELQVEYRMTKIHRIADLVDLENKIVYEIQCSPISKQEVIARNKAYKTLGFSVIWMLHDRLFNRKNPTDAEIYLKEKGCYYISMTEGGNVRIYKPQRQRFSLLEYYTRLRRMLYPKR